MEPILYLRRGTPESRFDAASNRFIGSISYVFQAIQKPCAPKTQISVLGCFVNFLVIFLYIWEEIVFLKRVVKFGEIRNS